MREAGVREGVRRQECEVKRESGDRGMRWREGKQVKRWVGKGRDYVYCYNCNLVFPDVCC